MRWVQARADQRGLAVEDLKGDNAFERIVKYVPSEIVAAYTMLLTLGLTTIGGAAWAAIVLMVLFLGATIAYILLKTPAGSRTAHLVVSPLAFLAWAYPISSAVLGDLFIPLAAFFAQAIVIGLSIFVVPKSS